MKIIVYIEKDHEIGLSINKNGIRHFALGTAKALKAEGVLDVMIVEVLESLLGDRTSALEMLAKVGTEVK